MLKIPLKFIQSYTRGVMISKMKMASFLMNGLMGPCVGAVKHFTTIFQFFGVKLVLVGWRLPVTLTFCTKFTIVALGVSHWPASMSGHKMTVLLKNIQMKDCYLLCWYIQKVLRHEREHFKFVWILADAVVDIFQKITSLTNRVSNTSVCFKAKHTSVLYNLQSNCI